MRASPFRHSTPEALVARDRIVGLDRRDDPRHARHHLSEVELRGGAAQAEVPRAPHVAQKAGGADEGLGGDATGVETIAAHLVFFDERDLGPHGCRDVGGDEPGRARPDHHEVALELPRPRKALQAFSLLVPTDRTLGEERKDPEQGEGQDEPGREDPPQGLEGPDLAPGVHVHERSGQHADLAHESKRRSPDRREAHQEVDDEEREDRDEAQRQEIKRAIPFDTGIDGAQLSSEAPLHEITQQKTGGEKRQQGPERAREGHDDRAPEEPEECTRDQCHERRAGQGQRGHRDIQAEEPERRR